MESAEVIYVVISLVTLIVFFVMADNVSQIKKSLNHNSARHINCNKNWKTNLNFAHAVVVLFFFYFIFVALVFSVMGIMSGSDSSKVETETPPPIQHFNPSGKFH